MKTIPWLTLLILLNLRMPGQTYTGTGGIIPDNGLINAFTIQVSELPYPDIDTTWGLETVCLNLLHPWDADLEMALQAPDGTWVDLVSMHGGGDDNFINTCFNGEGEAIILAWAPFTGTFRPFGDLGIVNNGQSGIGEWKLLIHDMYPWADEGTLLNWSITFGDDPSLPFDFESSNLPVISINTLGEFIPDDPKIMAHMGIIDNGPGQPNHLTDPFNGYDGYIGIERRGSSSQGFPKKSFGFETWDELGQEIEVSLLGMPEESDWILNAHYSDKTLMRNVLSYYLSNRMGRYASRTRFCELFLNGQYWGVYAFMEKIKRDPNRVDIAKLDEGDTTGTELTGGYILKIDKTTGSGGQGWTSPYPPPVNQQGQTIFFQYEYPGYEDLKPQQEEYIKAYVDTFETALYNFEGHAPFTHHQYLDLYSFADYFILNELAKNIDAYRLSTFFHKDKEGKIVMGPVWDFDIAWGNANYCQGTETYGWVYMFGQEYCPGDQWQIPFWWSQLMTDSLFVQEVRCRWNLWRTTFLDNDSVFSYINEQVALLDEGQERNFTQWPILGVWVWPNPWPLPTTYAGEIVYLKQFLMSRLNWLDYNLPGDCPNLSVAEEGMAGIRIYPNPATDRLNIEFTLTAGELVRVELTNSLGLLVQSANLRQNSSNSPLTLDCSHLPPGLYLLKVVKRDSILVMKILIAS